MAEVACVDVRYLPVEPQPRAEPAPPLIGVCGFGDVVTPRTGALYQPNIATVMQLLYRDYVRAEKITEHGAAIQLPHAVSAGLISFYVPGVDDEGTSTYVFPPGTPDRRAVIQRALLSTDDADLDTAAKYTGPYLSIVERPNTSKHIVVHDRKYMHENGLQIVAFRGTTQGVVTELVNMALDTTQEDSYHTMLPADTVAVAAVTGASVIVPKGAIKLEVNSSEGVDTDELILALEKLKLMVSSDIGPANHLTVTALCFGNPALSLEAANIGRIREARQSLAQSQADEAMRLRQEKDAEYNSAESKAARAAKAKRNAKIAVTTGLTLGIQLSPWVPAGLALWAGIEGGKRVIPQQYQRLSAIALALVLGITSFGQWGVAGYTDTTPYVNAPKRLVEDSEWWLNRQKGLLGNNSVASWVLDGEASLLRRAMFQPASDAAGSGKGGPEDPPPAEPSEIPVVPTDIKSCIVTGTEGAGLLFRTAPTTESESRGYANDDSILEVTGISEDGSFYQVRIEYEGKQYLFWVSTTYCAPQ